MARTDIHAKWSSWIQWAPTDVGGNGVFENAPTHQGKQKTRNGSLRV